MAGDFLQLQIRLENFLVKVSGQSADAVKEIGSFLKDMEKAIIGINKAIENSGAISQQHVNAQKFLLNDSDKDKISVFIFNGIQTMVDKMKAPYVT